MKYLLLTTLFFSFSSFANWVKESEVKAPKTIWSKKSRCLTTAAQGKNCFDISGKDIRHWKVGPVDDLNSPILRAAEDSPIKLNCDDFDDCRTKALDPNGDLIFDDNVCIPDESNAKWDLLSNWSGMTGVTGPWFIWCEKDSGTFEQKNILVTDPTGIIAADIADDIQDVKDIEEANIRLVKIKMECGRSVIALIVIRNVPKNLTRAQKKTMKESYRDAKEFLELGALTEAKEEIEIATPDGTIVTEADKTAIIVKIDECLAQ